MKLAIMQPYFFPYIGYFQLIGAVDKFVFYDDVNFIKGGWINRNRILVNDQPVFISVPLENISSFKKINETKISSDKRWKDKMLKSISLSYKKAPYFDSFYPTVKAVIETEFEFIGDLAKKSITATINYIKMESSFVTSEVFANGNLNGKERVIDICKKEKTDDYINAIGGMELYHKDEFKLNKIELSFLKPHLEHYIQFGTEFQSGLSIIDVAMFNSPERLKTMVGNFSLV